jgi:tetratricopeptide (TPR) repeat protein
MHIVEDQTVRNQMIVFDPFPLLGPIVRGDNALLTEEEPLHKPIEHGQRARLLTRALGDVGLQVVANFYVGIVYYELGDARQTAECLRWNIAFLEGKLIHEHFGMTGLPSVLSRAYLSWSLAELGVFDEGSARGEEGLGKLYVDQGDVHRAILMLERGLELCQTWDTPTLFPQMARSLGAAYALSGRVDEALPLLEQAASTGRKGSQAVSFTHLSQGYLSAGRMEEALHYAHLALKRAQECKRRCYQAYALHLLGEIAVHQKPPEVEQAEAHYREALALAEELGMRPLKAHCHRSFGMLYSQTSHSEHARAELFTAIEMYRDMEMTFWLPQAEATLAEVAR